MPTHKSAAKRVLQTAKRRARNRHVKATLRGQIKDARAAIGKPEANAALPEAIRLLGKAASKGVIHKKQASRKIGRLMRAANKAAAPKA